MDGRAWILGLGFAVASVAGCFDGDFLIHEQCSKDGDCGRGQECREGLCTECAGSVCDDYVCPVEEIDGECPCPGRAKFECAQLSTAATDKLDILFVIDNSGPARQERLAGATNALRDTLRDNRVDARIAITTTDMGNPANPNPVTAPAMGDFMLDSCLDRLEAFEVDGVDVRESCTEVCEYASIATIATATGAGGDALARPWIETKGTESNLADDLALADALPCVMPPGIGGSGFESPHEAMYQALRKAGAVMEAGMTPEPAAPNEGFLRDDAHLLVVLMTDQADCSYNSAFDEIFTDSNQTFWGPAGEANPSICWNAGVECIGEPLGDPMTYFDCVPADKTSDGSLTLNEDQAVLYPLWRYIDALEWIETDKNEGKEDGEPRLEVVVSVIAGIPERDFDASSDDGQSDEAEVEVAYQVGVDEDFELEHGIAPGCTLSPGNDPGAGFSAVPPVRLLEFAERVAETNNDENIYSVCAQDDPDDPMVNVFDGVFEEITLVLEQTIPALCMPVCVAEPANCALSYWDEDQEVLVDIPDCASADEGEPCFHALSGDEVADSCAQADMDAGTDTGGNVQFTLEEFALGGRDIYASCEPATSSTNCPTGE